MKDSQKTKQQLVTELNEARQQLNLLSAGKTKRKKTGRELKQSEDKFYKAFLSSPDMIIISSIGDGIYLDVNDSFVNVTGYRREELIGHTFDEFNFFINRKDQERIQRLLQEHGIFRNEEFSFRIKSGEIRHWLCSAEIININNDTCMIAVATDITEQKRMEQALIESENKFARAFRSSPQAIAITTLKEGKFIDVNDSYTRITGFTREDVIGHTSAELKTWLHPADRQRITRKLKEKSHVENEELEFRTKSGDTQIFLFSAETINIGGRECIISSSTDITERKQMESALRESEEKYSKAFRASPEIISISRLSDGVYKEVNESFLRIFGYTIGEVIGQKSLALGIWVKPDDRANMLRMLKEKGRISNEEYLFRNKAGDIRVMLFSAEQIECDGEPCVLAVTNDITDLKYMKAQAREAENLRQVDKLRTELLANVSHELRTPLASIKGFATMLMDYGKRLKAQEKREYLETIDKNADRLVELIEQLLEMSRLGVGMLSIKKAPVNIVTLCQTVIGEARVRSPEYNFVLHFPQKLPKINIDNRRIRQVLDNIIDNSVKYSNSGTEITLSVHKSGDDLLFTVTDHGVGIPEQDLPQLFHKMFHSPRGQKTGVPGAGLGLSICKGLIEAHGGRIWIESKEGVGTKCYFTLPIANTIVKKTQNNSQEEDSILVVKTSQILAPKD